VRANGSSDKKLCLPRILYGELFLKFRIEVRGAFEDMTGLKP